MMNRSPEPRPNRVSRGHGYPKKVIGRERRL